MVLTDDGRTAAQPTAGAAVRRPLAFRPASRGRSRLAAGIALGAVAIAGNVIVYSGLDERVPVLQAARDVPAGAVLGRADVRVVRVDAGGDVRTIPAELLDSTVGRYAKVRIVAGSLVVAEALQDDPLVAPGAAVVAVQVPEGSVPAGLRERSHVQLVLGGRTGAVTGAGSDADVSPVVVAGLLVGLPGDAQTVTGTVSMSVEVAAVDAPLVALADDVGVVLVDPGPGDGS